jgi:glycosyltransferase involved in cell wall biosynthesis
MMRTRLLIIPHQPHRNVQVRTVEMAKYLAAHDGFEVFMLTWQASSRPSRNPAARLFNKAMEVRRTLNTPHRMTEEHGIRWVTLPYLLAPDPLCQWYNGRQVERFVREHHIDLILSSNAYHFPTPKAAHLKTVYDVVDDHLSPGSGPVWPRTRAFTLNELSRADRIITISHALQDELAQLGFPHALRIPNGVHLERYHRPQPQAVQAIHDQYGLQNAFTIGYIGNHGWWSGMELLLDAFAIVQQTAPHSRLLIVGPGEELPHYQARCANNPSIIFTGPIAPTEIVPYFQAIDLGVLPFQQCPFTDNAMPLKILEYGAARKPALATPLKELATLRFPHVSLLEPNSQRWADEILHVMQSPQPWLPAWDEALQPYDWHCILKALETTLHQAMEHHSHAPVV